MFQTIAHVLWSTNGLSGKWRDKMAQNNNIFQKTSSARRMNVKVASSYASRQAYEEATFTFILLVEDVLKSYRWNELLPPLYILCSV